MKIAHVIDSLEVGGAEAVVAALSRLQVATGNQVSVHCLLKGGPLAEELAKEGIPVSVYGPPHSGNPVWRLYRDFRRIRPNVVHCHNKAATVRAAGIARVTGTEAVFSTRHGMAPPPYRLRKDFKYWLFAALFCSRVIAVCETARQNMLQNAKALARRVITIRNGAYPARSCGKDVGTPGQGFTIITVGRLAPAKNYPALLRSVALAKSRVPDIRLWIIGNGREAPTLKALAGELGIADAVHFFGEQSEVGDWLRCADVFMLSSLSEGLPISILEAMAAGLPTIVTNVGGMPEVLKLSGAGKVVSAGNIEEMAEAIMEYASRRHELHDIGQRARACYLQHFRPERMAEDYLNLYRACLSGTRTTI